jgi:hypothetical protein
MAKITPTRHLFTEKRERVHKYPLHEGQRLLSDLCELIIPRGKVDMTLVFAPAKNRTEQTVLKSVPTETCQSTN